MAQTDLRWKRTELGVNCYLDLDTFEGDIENAIAALQKIKDDAENAGFRNVQIDPEVGYGYNEGSVDFNITAERLETTKEAEKRVEATRRKRKIRKKEKDLAEERKYKTYLKLKKEYEGGQDETS